MASANREPVEVLLVRVAGQWRSVADDIARLAVRLRGAVGEAACRQLVPGLDDVLEELRSAVTRFESSAKKPAVVIATSGTTSSGKSTLANLLIGETLLPKAVQEMSAGVVAVQHHESVRKLIVEDTKGASWETGTWDDVAPTQVQELLEKTMQTYRDLLGDDGEQTRKHVEPPRFQIVWPTRMGRHPAHFGLPSGTQLTIVDLPGLKYVDDKVNGDVVREQARKALCIVAYNSFETDPLKQESLLRQVVDQVKALRGSPARMLFTLNKIDAFRTDHNPEDSEQEFTKRVTQQIRDRVSEALSEYADEAGKIEPIPLSSEPALYAVLAEQRHDEAGHALLRKLAKEYAVLFPDAEMDQLPRSPVGWSDDQRRWFINETRHQSRLDDFERRLAAHIAQHLPELLVPDLVEASYGPACKVLAKLDALVGAYSVQERTQAEEAIGRLESLHQRLKGLKAEALKALNPLREAAASGNDDLLDRLHRAVPEVEGSLGLVQHKLSAIREALPNAVIAPLQRLDDYIFRLMKGEPIEDALMESAASAPSFHAALKDLRASPYAEQWKTGGRFEGDAADRVSLALQAFAKELSSMASSLVKRESAVQAERMKGALGVLSEAIVNKLEADVATELEQHDFPGLHGVFHGAFDLKPPQLPGLRFKPEMKDWTVTAEKVVTEEYSSLKRVWWKLWLGKSEVKETRQVVVQTTTTGIEVKGLQDLIRGFMSSGGGDELEASFAAWLGEGVSGFDKALEQRLQDGVKTYRLALEERMADIERGTEARIDGVEQHRTDIHDARQAVEAARQWRGFADG